MGILRFAVWTSACIALGIGLATVQVRGKTPLDRAQQAWDQGLRDEVNDGLHRVVDKARDAVAHEKVPHEHHSEEDRRQLEKLIAKSNGAR